MLGALVGLVVAAAAWPLIGPAFSEHSYFAVREVVVRAPAGVPAAQVRQLAGVEPGKSIWGVDCRAAEQRLRATPWIRSARVRRELPHRVVIQLRTERPMAIASLRGKDGAEQLYFVGAHGRVFATLGDGDPRDFPYLTGLTASDVQGADPFGARAIRRALGLVRLVARGEGGVTAVSEIHIDRARGLTLLPLAPRVPIELGWGGYAAKLARVPPVLERLKGRETEIASLSVVFADEVIVRGRAPKTEPSRRRGRTA